VQIFQGEVTANRKRTAANNEISKSEVFMVAQFGEQRYEFDIECPRGLDKKNPTNQFLFYKFSKSEDDFLTLWLEERIYKLERDEAAFLQSIRNVNTKQSTSINQFLLN